MPPDEASSQPLARFDASRAQIRLAHERIPGGVSSNFRLGISPTPLVFERAEGPWLHDLDGNRLIDYYLGMGPMILGHSPACVVEAVAQQLGKGILYGGQSLLEAEVAERFCSLVPCAEKVRFAASGSEVVQAALRLARAATGRHRILKFEGHYHGWMDSVLVSVAQVAEAGQAASAPLPAGAGWAEHPPEGAQAVGHSDRQPAYLAVPGSAGQDAPSWEHVVVLPWNDLAQLRARVAEGDIAAVLMEPAMCNAGAIAPLPGYLEGVREICSQTGTVLIFDEVITGFRLAAGGAQERFAVTPDLATFGKCLASGFPAAAIAGRAEIMDLFASGGVVHGGTYNAHPVCLAAARATLDTLADGRVIASMEVAGTRLMQGIRDVLASEGICAQVEGFAQIFHVAFGLAQPARNYRDLMHRDTKLYVRFCTALLSRRVRALERGAWFLSSAHDDCVIDATLLAVAQAAQAIRKEGLA